MPELELSVVDGDITALEVDAIANAANNALWMGAGVAGAIKRAGGEEIEREAVAKGPIEVGEAVATGAGRLPAKWVIHGAVMGQDLRTDAALVRRTTESCLRVADEVGARSLALPAFGTGVGGFPLDECARIMVEAVRGYDPSSLEQVVFAVFGEEAARCVSGGALTRLTIALVSAAIAVAGCTPLAPVSEQAPPARTQPSSGTREPDCSRQFDDNDAGFQLCRRGESEGSE